MDKRFFLVVVLLFVVWFGVVAPAVAVGSFAVSVQPSTQTVSPGMSAAYSVAVASSGGFASSVTLSLSNAGGLPSSISVSSFLPSNVVNPPSGGSDFAILVVQTTGSTPVGTYQLTISGVGGGLSQSASVVLVVTETTTFALSVTPVSQTIGLGSSGQFQIGVTSIALFSASVALDLELAAPAGVSYTITPSTVTPTAGGTATATLQVSVGSNVTPDSYALILKGSTQSTYCPTLTSIFVAGQCVDYSFVVVQVPAVTDFQITVSPVAQSVAINDDALFNVQAASVGGFSSQVQLDLNKVPSGVDFSFNPATITPTQATPATSTLTVSPSANALAGTYKMDLVATGQGNTETATISVTILAIGTQLTVEAPFTDIKRGDAFTITGNISPVIVGATIDVIYTRPDGTEFTRMVQTASDGTFSDQYTPDAPNLVGPWKVRAEYGGTSAYSASKSQTYDFQVTEKSFLEKYGLLWIEDYALWIALLIIVIIVAIMGIFAALRRRSREEKMRPPPSPAPVLAPEPIPPPVRQRPATVITTAAPKKVCFNCGEVIAANARFCDKCDARQPE